MLTYEEWRGLALFFMFVSFRLSWNAPYIRQGRKQARRYYADGVKRFKGMIK